MGFWQLESFNKALLAKQLWRIVKDLGSQVARVLKARYFKHQDIMQAPLCNNPSYTWRSLLWSRQLLNEGLRWWVCNGERISTFQDHWIPGLKSLPRPPGYQQNLEIMNTLILTGSWNEPLARTIIPSYKVPEVLELPLSQISIENSRYWYHDPKGKYSVRDGYKLDIGFYDSPNHTSADRSKKWWKFLWSLSVPSKVRIFWWRAISNIIPTQANLIAHHVPGMVSCQLCQHKMDSTCQALFWCPVAKKCWKKSMFMPVLKQVQCLELIDICLRMKEVFNKSDLDTFFMHMWAVWHERLRILYVKGHNADQMDIEWSDRLLRDLQKVQETLNIGLANKALDQRAHWKCPTVNHLKLEVDAAVNDATGSYSIGRVVRDHEGQILIAFGRKISKPLSVVYGELVPIHDGLHLVQERRFPIHEITTDSLLAVQAVTNPAEDFSYTSLIAMDIRNLLGGQHRAHLSHVSRTANVVAHELASFVISSPSPLFGNLKISFLVSKTCNG